MNNAIVLELKHRYIEKPCVKKMYCNCPLHNGSLVQQVEGLLCNGKPIVVLLDLDGYHVLIGQRGQELDLEFPPPAISETEMWQMITEAIES